MRLGDVLAALGVLVLAQQLELPPTVIAAINAVLALFALGLAWRVARSHDHASRAAAVA